MSILSVDDLAYGMAASPGPIWLQKTGTTMEAAGLLHSKWYEAGSPGAGSAPSPGLNGAALSSASAMVAGQIPFVAAASGKTKHLALVDVAADQPGALLIFDRLWHNSSIVSTTTTAQAITPAAAPARDIDGAALGNGVIAALEVSAATGNGSPVTNTTISYTDEAGNTGSTGTIASFPASAAAGTLVPFQLAAGDRGVRSIQSITLGTSYVSGTVHLLLLRPIAIVPVSALVSGGAAYAGSKSWDQLGLPKLHDGTVPFLAWLANGTTAANILSGQIAYAEK
jgi:hypothetical protein